MRSIISPLSAECLGAQVASLGVAAAASAAWPLANQANLVPLALSTDYMIRAVFVANGGVVAGNFDVGVYDTNLSRVFSSGAVAQAGVSVVQIVNVRPFLLRAGDYYLGLSFSVNTAQVQRSLLSAAIMGQVVGLGGYTAAHPLPVRLVFGPVTTTYLPHFGLLSDRRFW